MDVRYTEHEEYTFGVRENGKFSLYTSHNVGGASNNPSDMYFGTTTPVDNIFSRELFVSLWEIAKERMHESRWKYV